MNIDAYIDLVSSIHARICFFDEFEKDTKILIIRHDVDHDLNKAVQLAEIEAKNGIRSTYFILHNAKYFDYSDKLAHRCKTIRDYGHQIGFHNDALTVWLRTQEPMKEVIAKPLKFLRSNGIVVKYSSAHGSPLMRKYNFKNFQIWKGAKRGPLSPSKQLRLSDFGLKDEVYLMPFNYYWSESGNKWRGGRVPFVGWFERDFSFLNTEQLHDSITEFNQMENVSAQLLTHPK